MLEKIDNWMWSNRIDKKIDRIDAWVFTRPGAVVCGIGLGIEIGLWILCVEPSIKLLALMFGF